MSTPSEGLVPAISGLAPKVKTDKLLPIRFMPVTHSKIPTKSREELQTWENHRPYYSRYSSQPKTPWTPNEIERWTIQNDHPIETALVPLDFRNESVYLMLFGKFSFWANYGFLVDVATNVGLQLKTPLQGHYFWYQEGTNVFPILANGNIWKHRNLP